MFGNIFDEQEMKELKERVAQLEHKLENLTSHLSTLAMVLYQNDFVKDLIDSSFADVSDMIDQEALIADICDGDRE